MRRQKPNVRNNIVQTSPQPASILSQNEIINFNDLFQANVPSPVAASPSNLAIGKMSPSSPYTPSTQQTYDFMPTSQTKPILKSQVSKSHKSKSFSSNSSVTSNGSSNSSKTNRSSRTNSQSSNGPGSNASSGSSSTKKLSQLIFHEYRGPNQKSSKSSISLKTNISLKKNSNNLINAFNFQKSNLVVNNSKLLRLIYLNLNLSKSLFLFLKATQLTLTQQIQTKSFSMIVTTVQTILTQPS